MNVRETGAALLLSGSILLTGCSDPAASEKLPQSAVETSDGVNQAVKDWAAKYTCQQNVTVEYLDAIDENAPDGSNTIATAEPGLIKVDKTDIALKPYQEKRNIGLHEMAHACKPDEPLLLEDPFLLPDGQQIYGIHGFVPLNKTPGSKATGSGFRLIEEGAAEALAALSDDNYTATNPAYFALGNLTFDLMNKGQISPRELASLLTTNGLQGFISRISSNGLAGPAEIIQTMDLYQQAASVN